MNKISKGISIISIFSKNSVKNRSNLIVGAIIMFSRCAVTLLLYSYAYKINNNSINNSTFVESAWSMFLYFSFMMLSIRRLFRNIEHDILSGNVEMYIIKPIDYIKYNVLKKLGEDIIIFLLVTLIGAIFLAILVGIPSTFGLFTIISILVMGILGMLLSLLTYSIIGLLAFYIQRVEAIYRIIDKIIMIFGGSYLPIALFPKLMKDIATYSPFGAMNFLTSTVYKTWESEYVLKFCMQIIWIIILYFVLKTIYKKARERLAINGG